MSMMAVEMGEMNGTHKNGKKFGRDENTAMWQVGSVILETCSDWYTKGNNVTFNTPFIGSRKLFKLVENTSEEMVEVIWRYFELG